MFAICSHSSNVYCLINIQYSILKRIILLLNKNKWKIIEIQWAKADGNKQTTFRVELKVVLGHLFCEYCQIGTNLRFVTTIENDSTVQQQLYWHYCHWHNHNSNYFKRVKERENMGGNTWSVLDWNIIQRFISADPNHTVYSCSNKNHKSIGLMSIFPKINLKLEC